ncbi:MAG: flagellar motor stator protein MotA [Syntrophobacterales bacterium]|jgi:chemotaxis protein MotA|nr:flagellar motor stator protein MotA [Syntrophobacterales bacterium]
MLVIIGCVVVILCVAGGFLVEGGNLSILFQPAELLIIGGAAFGGFLIATPAAAVKQVLAGVLETLKGDPYGKKDYLDILQLLSEIFYKIRKQGLVAVEADVDNPGESAIFSKYPGVVKDHHILAFITDTLRTVITTQIEPYELDALMDMQLEEHHEELMIPSRSLATIADALPGLGIVAAVLGVVLSMQKIGEPPEVLGKSVGAALVGTFLGVLLCYGFFGPASRMLEHIATAKVQYMTVVKVVLKSFVSNNASPQVAIEFGRRIIPAKVRPDFYEVEDAIRRVKK